MTQAPTYADKASGFGVATLSHQAPVVPSDTVDFIEYPWQIICIAGGICNAVDSMGTAVSYPMQVGQSLPPRLKIRRVNATGTSGSYVAVYL